MLLEEDYKEAWDIFKEIENKNKIIDQYKKSQ